jgi:putative transcriptional regulator
MTNKAKSRMTKALLETAQDMRRAGVLVGPAYTKITKRHLREQDSPTIHPLSGNEIKALRQRARMSQAVFAHHLNVTPGYVSQLERGTKRPTGAALALLNVITRKGIGTIL